MKTAMSNIYQEIVEQETVYRLARLSKTYGERLVLDVKELEIGRGEVFALVGPSGSGKSTLLRLLNFLEEPTGGSLEFTGTVYRSGVEMPLELKRRVTMVFQRPMLFDRSVWDNVTYGLRLRGQRDAHDQVMEALDEVGLAHLAKQRARTLSGGEAQRVALARAIVLQPDVLLLDEPTANLDPYNVGLIENIIRRINEQHGTTLVLVTHNVFQARRLASRVSFLLDGKVIETADAESFFNAPIDPRTRAFVRGDMVY
jgi:tungstate transport system ATP-binding protein